MSVTYTYRCAKCGKLAERDNHDCTDLIVRVYLNELKQLAAMGDKTSIEAIDAMNRMFPNEKPITYK